MVQLAVEGLQGHPSQQMQLFLARPGPPKKQRHLQCVAAPYWSGSYIRFTVLTLDWSDPSLNVPPKMVILKASPGQSWLQGVINNFDFHAMFEEDLANLVEFYKT